MPKFKEPVPATLEGKVDLLRQEVGLLRSEVGRMIGLVSKLLNAQRCNAVPVGSDGWAPPPRDPSLPEDLIPF
jgi:hypothetical protein